MTKAAATKRRENSNRSRLEALVHASEELIRPHLRDAFAAKHPTIAWAHGAGVASAYPKLAPSLKGLQRKLLLEGDATTWDVTLLNVVFKKVNAGSSSSDASEKKKRRAAIATIVATRNLCAHAAAGRLKDADFDKHSKDVVKAYVALGGDEKTAKHAMMRDDTNATPTAATATAVAAPPPPRVVDAQATNAAIQFKDDGNKAFAAGEFRKAQLLYSRGVAIQGAVDTNVLAQLHSNRCATSMRLGESKHAKADSKRAAQLSPDWAKPHLRLGEVYLHTGNHSKAVASFETAQSMAQSNVETNSASLLEKIQRKLAEARALKDKDNRRESENLAYSASFLNEGRFRATRQAMNGLPPSVDLNDVFRTVSSLDMEKVGLGAEKHVMMGHLAQQKGRLHDAAREYLAAAHAGSADGMYNYGIMLKEGRGVAKNMVSAAKWFEKAAVVKPRAHAQRNLGIGEAMATLGNMYELGIHYTKDEAKARAYWEKATIMESSAGLNMLAICYLNGSHGVSVDLPKARDLFRCGAERFHNEAMMNLVDLHASLGDFDTAARWADTAHAFGFVPAEELAEKYRAFSYMLILAKMVASILKLQKQLENEESRATTSIRWKDMKTVETPFAKRVVAAYELMVESERLLVEEGKLLEALEAAAQADRIPGASASLGGHNLSVRYPNLVIEMLRAGAPMTRAFRLFVSRVDPSFAIGYAETLQENGMCDVAVFMTAATAHVIENPAEYPEASVHSGIRLLHQALLAVPHPEDDSDPATLQLLLELGVAYYEAGQWTSAERFLTRFLSHAVQDGHNWADDAHFILGGIVMQRLVESDDDADTQSHLLVLGHLRDGLALQAERPTCMRTSKKTNRQKNLEATLKVTLALPNMRLMMMLLANAATEAEATHGDRVKCGGELVAGPRRHTGLVRSLRDDDWSLLDLWRKKGCDWEAVRRQPSERTNSFSMVPPKTSQPSKHKGKTLAAATVDELISPLQDHVYDDRRLDCLVVSAAYFTGSSHLIMAEDSQREPVRLAVYNASPGLVRELLPGQVVSVRCPYVRISSDGAIMIRIDEPHEGIQVHEFHSVCWVCLTLLTTTTTRSCTKCHTAQYCSAPCQQKDWDAYGHRYLCQSMLSDSSQEHKTGKKTKTKKTPKRSATVVTESAASAFKATDESLEVKFGDVVERINRGASGTSSRWVPHETLATREPLQEPETQRPLVEHRSPVELTHQRVEEESTSAGSWWSRLSCW